MLAHAIAETQPFIDGNKRTAALAMEQFLEYNGYQLTATDDQIYDWILELSRGMLPDEFGDLIRPCVVRLGALGDGESSTSRISDVR